MGRSKTFCRLLFLLLILEPLTCLGLSIETKSTQIPTVVVTAHKPLFYSTSGAPKTLITQQDLAVTGVTSLSQALAELGGIQLQDTLGNGSQVMLSMRGFGVNANSNTLLLINGIPLNNPDLMPPDLNAIPLQEIVYIEIINGSESVLYGDQAVGGMINVITQSNLPKKIDISCSIGSYNTKNCYASLANHFKNLNFTLGLRRNTTNNYREHNHYTQHLLLGTLAYPFAHGKTTFDYKIIQENMQYPGALTANEVRQNRRQSSNNSDYFKDGKGFFHLNDQRLIANNWEMNTDLSQRLMKGSGILTSDFSQSRSITFFKPHFKKNFSHFTFITGFEGERDYYDLNTLFGTTQDRQKKYGLFALFDIPLTEKISFSIGGRGAEQQSHLNSQQETLNRVFTSTLGVTYQLSSQIKLYGRRAGSFRFPNADENASAPPGQNGLKTQRGTSYETGIQWAWQHFFTKVGLYQLNLVDEITFDPLQTPEQPFGSNRNLAPTTRHGFTFTEKYEFNHAVSFDAQYNYVTARFQQGINQGNRIPLVSQNNLHAGCNYAFAEHWNFYSEAIFTGNQYAANDDANVGGAMGGYTLFNANIGYTYQQVKASFRINNIFNKYYYFYTVYSPMTNSDSFYPAPGRNIMFTLSYIFV